MRWHGFVLASGLLGASAASAVPVLEVTFGDPGVREVRVEPGSMVAASIRMRGVPAGSDGRGLFGFGFTLTFDESGLAPSAPMLGPLWAGKGFSSEQAAVGELGLTANRFFESSGPSGEDVLLATLLILVQGEGRFELTLGPATGPGDNILYDGTRLDEGAAFFSGSSAIVGVPEPGTWMLMAAGFIVLAVGRRTPHSRGIC